ncbi:tripartite tricarboxylate transporter TctB family protein [Falsiroseomonas sp. E2-1-a4]|uniref:tripartite tricarboxylate transporter TctB family protein n=1 Tax=Falsiroseomonas sp. E2-1-a4 TaxID=3239299 RepID=UPI003F375C70
MSGGLTGAIGGSRAPVADCWLAVFVTGLAALLWFEAEKLPPPFFDPLGSAAVPQGIAVILLVLAALVALRAGIGLAQRKPRVPAEYRARPDVAVGIVLLTIGYVGVMQARLVGFELASVAFVALASALLGLFERRIMLIGLLIALVLGFGGTWLFTGFFYIDLPR